MSSESKRARFGEFIGAFAIALLFLLYVYPGTLREKKPSNDANALARLGDRIARLEAGAADVIAHSVVQETPDPDRQVPPSVLAPRELVRNLSDQLVSRSEGPQLRASAAEAIGLSPDEIAIVNKSVKALQRRLHDYQVENATVVVQSPTELSLSIKGMSRDQIAELRNAFLDEVHGKINASSWQAIEAMKFESIAESLSLGGGMTDTFIKLNTPKPGTQVFTAEYAFGETMPNTNRPRRRGNGRYSEERLKGEFGHLLAKAGWPE